jgi:hypothetical protein
MSIAGLVDHRRVDIDRSHGMIMGNAFKIPEFCSLGSETANLSLVKKDNAICMFNDGRHVRGTVRFIVAEGDDERGAFSNAVKFIRAVSKDDDERKSTSAAFEQFTKCFNRLSRIQTG